MLEVFQPSLLVGQIEHEAAPRVHALHPTSRVTVISLLDSFSLKISRILLVGEDLWPATPVVILIVFIVAFLFLVAYLTGRPFDRVPA